LGSDIAKNSQWRVLAGIWEQSPQPPEARGSGGETLSAGQFGNFLMKITHFYAYLGQNNILKQTHQLKAFEKQSKRTNRINEVQVL